jgi:TolB-like protein
MDQETPNALRLSLLGRFELRARDGGDATPAARKVRALLACLALSPGAAWPREKLMALLWSGRGEEQARASLRQALAELRRALGEPSPLRTESDAVSLDPATIAVDAVEFGRLGKVGRLEEAGALYRGDLLDGHGVRDPAFEDWLLVERTRLHDLAVDVLARLAESQAGDPAIETALRLLRIEPAREDTHRTLMRLYAAAGRRAQALRQYQTCRETLQREMGVAPDAETERLLLEIQEDKPRPPSAAAPAPASAPPAATDKPSIAVLPFANMSGDPEQQYFSDGITEDIITELSRFRDLRVIARNASFRFRDPALDARQVGRELGARYLVDGSIRRLRARVRIAVRLVDATTCAQLWAERYDRPAEDIFAIQDDVVSTVAATVAGRLEAAGAEGLRRRPTASLSAYECVLRGHTLPVGDPAEEDAALRLFEQAVALDPDYALAHARLAISHLNRWIFEMSDSNADIDRAFELATRAVALDSHEIVCHTALGYIQLYRRCFDEAEFHARKALTLNPNRPNSLVMVADVLASVGRPDDAVAFVADAMRLDPYHPPWYWTELGRAHFAARQHAEAVAAFRHRSDLEFFSHTYLAACHMQLGEEGAMRGEVSEVMRLKPHFSVAAFMATEPYKSAVDREHLASSLRKAGLPE